MASEKIKIVLEAQDKNVKKTLSGLGKSVDGLTSKLKKNSGAFKASGAALTGMGLAATGIATGAINAAREQIRVENQLAAVLKSTGGAAGLSAEEIKNHASALQKMTNFGDEAIIGGQNLLLTFKNIGKDTFPRATETLLDMSAAMGQDLKSSAIQLGKALNDPITGMSALSRVGITFTDQQKEQVKAMMESGDVAGAQALILKELESQFKGSAKAQADSMIQAKNAMGDIAEEIGTALIPMIKPLVKLIISLTEKFKNLSPRTKTIMAGIIALTAAVGLIAGPLLLLIGFLPALTAGFGAVAAIISGPVLLSLASVLAPVLAIIAVVALLKTAWERDWGGIQEKTQTVIDAIRGIVEFGIGALLAPIQIQIALIKTAIEVGMALITGDWEKAWDTISSKLDIFTEIKDKVQSGIDDVFGILFGSGMLDVRDSWGGAWNEMESQTETSLSSIGSTTSSWISSIESTIISSVDNWRDHYTDAQQTIIEANAAIATSINQVTTSAIAATTAIAALAAATVGTIPGQHTDPGTVPVDPEYVGLSASDKNEIIRNIQSGMGQSKAAWNAMKIDWRRRAINYYMENTVRGGKPFDGEFAHTLEQSTTTPFARGGIATRAVNAVLGEAGSEAIIPLNRRGISILSEAFKSAMGAVGGMAISITGNTFVVRTDNDINLMANAILRQARIDRTRRT